MHSRFLVWNNLSAYVLGFSATASLGWVERVFHEAGRHVFQNAQG